MPISRVVPRPDRRTKAASFGLVFCALSCCLTLGITTPAWAQFDVTAIYVAKLDDGTTGTASRLSENGLLTYFNRARCSCDTLVRVTIEITPDRSDTDTFVVVAGQHCLTSENEISAGCKTLREGRISEQETDIEFDVSVKELMIDDCAQDGKNLSITVYKGQDRAFSAVGAIAEYTADGTPPAAPTRASDPQPGEGGITIEFNTGSTTETQVTYQLLCALADKTPWTPAAKFEPAYVHESQLCTGGTSSTDGGADAGASSVDAATADATISDAGGDASSDAVDASTDSTAMGSALPSDLLANARYLCSGELASDGKKSIQGLTNGKSYDVYVVALDASGNATEPVSLGRGSPIPAEDLWERYKRSGGQATGTYCQVHAIGRPPGGETLGIALLLIGWIIARKRSKPGSQPTEKRK